MVFMWPFFSCFMIMVCMRLRPWYLTSTTSLLKHCGVTRSEIKQCTLEICYFSVAQLLTPYKHIGLNIVSQGFLVIMAPSSHDHLSVRGLDHVYGLSLACWGSHIGGLSFTVLLEWEVIIIIRGDAVSSCVQPVGAFLGRVKVFHTTNRNL